MFSFRQNYATPDEAKKGIEGEATIPDPVKAVAAALIDAGDFSAHDVNVHISGHIADRQPHSDHDSRVTVIINRAPMLIPRQAPAAAAEPQPAEIPAHDDHPGAEAEQGGAKKEGDPSEGGAAA